MLFQLFICLLCQCFRMLNIIQDFAQIQNVICTLGIALFHELIGFALAFGQRTIVVFLLNFERNRK